MALRLRQLSIRATTPHGQYGLDLSFDAGLSVVRADNSSGKSTCVQSIIFALGLDGMLTPSHTVPLQSALIDKLQDEGGNEIPVIESEVLLELENARGEIITIQRAAVSSSRRSTLVTVHFGALLTRGETGQKRDFFVRVEGAAQRERGYHHFLASYLGWSLPTVLRNNGTSTLLYLECIFPLLIVEQKHGWSGIQARLPIHFGIREMGKRATEFLLKLDAYQIAMERLRIDDEMQQLKLHWESAVKELQRLAASVDGVWEGLASEPTATWPPRSLPRVLIHDRGTWTNVQDVLRTARVRLKDLESREIPRVEQVSDELSTKLREREEELALIQTALAQLFEEVEIEKAQIDSLGVRVSALSIDLRNFADTQRLLSLGSDSPLQVSQGICPTCQQHVNDTLLPQDGSDQAMSIADNIGFIRGQLQTFEAMREDAKRVLRGKSARLAIARKRADELRLEIRELRQTLISDSRLPSAAAIRERLILEARVRSLETVQGQIAESLSALEILSKAWLNAQSRLRGLQAEI